MTKRKKVIVDASDGVSSEELSEAGRVLRDGVKPPPGKAEGPQLFTRGEWKGLPQWKCALCQWDTLKSEAEMMAHIREVHMPTPPKASLKPTGVVDRFGNQIMMEDTNGLN